jgi:hypothetical protein
VYGTVATMWVKPGMESKLNELSDQWWRERAPKVKGIMSNTVFRTNDNEYILIAVFDSKENYEANAGDPEQDAWYQQMRACLEADPDWNDGEVIFARHQH